MQPDLSAPHSPPRPSWKRPGPVSRRWSIPLLATIAIGYGITQYGTMRTDSHIHIAEEERIRKNQQLMDAYGYKDNIDDLQKALEAYEVR
ncbi:hypothetical protein ASPVEDRAFT_86179 [Aspergillus versicolor CBS 583.65]|uniref:Uncharacterized protein n=1 Tax=Aspergillus versicolor CBS 583.65 TaxID=1036611 RepID=A0A1L9PTE3_ASPVE|nr:uncharacterized protein ASPVEDRAFT_86179 [Aspergillus versicolor CBS 583.65]OJJ04799.1 hypothetical protein ASPVEDRAFT_86179 [Aspergillus versicolor CBS 583.65]